VDDRIAICGSSNINDRSQLGNHDSELTIIMEDTNALPSIMDGREYQAGHHAATLRRMLWREHLGLLPAQPLDASEDPNAQPPDVCPNSWHEGDEYDRLVTDPLCDEVWNLWTQQATTNTDVFRHLFHADPDDNIRTFDDYQNFLPRNDTLVNPHNVHVSSRPASSSMLSETTNQSTVHTSMHWEVFHRLSPLALDSFMCISSTLVRNMLMMLRV
jgi:hypothetical protein